MYILLMALLGLLSVADARAEVLCSCVAPLPSPAEARSQADAVFLGTVVRIHDPQASDELRSLLRQRATVFAVRSAWKGVAADTVTVLTGWGGGDCGYPFEIGKSYLVYAQESRSALAPGLRTGICSLTKRQSEAAEDLDALGAPLTRREYAGSPQGQIVAAGVAFRSAVSDSVVRDLVRRYGLEVRAIWTTTGGHDGQYSVTSGEPLDSALTSARRATLQQIQRTACGLRNAIERVLSAEYQTRSMAPLQMREEIPRMVLSDAHRTLAAHRAARTDPAMIWGVTVAGRAADIARLEQDARVGSVERSGPLPDRHLASVVAIRPPRPPATPRRDQISPEVAALSPAEVEARLKQARDEVAAVCPFPSVSGPPPAAGAADRAPMRPRTIDDEFEELARVVPGGFGGLWLTGTVLNVYLKDLSKRAEATAMLKERLAGQFGPGAPGNQRAAVDLDQIAFYQGRYDFVELRTWYQRLLRTGIPGFTMSDIDEMENRIEIGVRDEALIPRVQQRAADLGIPTDALVVRQRPPARMR